MGVKRKFTVFGVKARLSCGRGCDLPKGHKAKVSRDSSEDDGALLAGGLIAGGMSANWIVDSGATSHIFYDRDLFMSYQKLEKPEKVTIDDRRSLRAIGHGTVSLTMKVPGGRSEPRNMLETLHILELSFNLVSVSKAVVELFVFF